MEILVKRSKQGPNSTLSQYFVNGSRRHFMLEDKDRGLTSSMTLEEIKAIKVWGQTAIPTGRYRVVVEHSPTFKRRLPRLQKVPGYGGILIHTGNWISDTKGCLIPGLAPGQENGEYCVWHSRKAFDPLFKEINEALEQGEEVWCTVEREYIPSA